ncbi:fatty acid hydroxylase domain-containing protein 2-like [Chironomus tepperi]|uniref:fatty acid hydroxylase domain-containing protein 2-like n=1 Tax=Chironomus tepperi TaxID=113505 RepID=UPI00391F9242
MQIIFRTAPVYFWMFTIWCISKVFQCIYKQEKTVWELIWDQSLIYFDEYNLFVDGILIISSISTFWLLAMYSIFDFTQKPAFIRKYKVNPNTNEPPDHRKFIKVLVCSTFSGFFVARPAIILIYFGLKVRGIPDIRVLPNIQNVLITCFINDHLLDIVAYTVHRLLHHRLIYKHIHKKHHEYKSTIAVAGLHTHPLEQLFLGIMPLGLGYITLRCHIATAWIHILSSVINSTITHSGYHLPFLGSPAFHDYHHVKFDCNYSILGLMDRIFRTDKAYRNSIYERRDIVLMSFESTRELYPDVNDKVL